MSVPHQCAKEQQMDCSGRCFTPTLDCPLIFDHLSTCDDWLGNGCCNEGAGGYKSDSGFEPDFNCPMWGCDGGDCDGCRNDPILNANIQYRPTKFNRCRDYGPIQVDDQWSTCEEVIKMGLMSCEMDLCDGCNWAGYCDRSCGFCSGTVSREDNGVAATCIEEEEEEEAGGKEEGREEDEYCILLTAAISPAQDMTHTVRKQPMLRLREYEKVVSRYANLSRDWIERGDKPPSIVFVENSGSNLTTLRDLSAAAPNIEFISWHDLYTPPVSRGKGIFEYRSIQYGIDNSEKIKNCKNVVKVTGRYFAKSLFDEIERLKKESTKYKLVVQSTENFWNMHENDGGIIRSEIVGFEKQAAGWLFRGQNEALGLPMERILRLRVRELNEGGAKEATEGAVGYFGAMEIDPTRNAEGVVIEFL
ncbi:hypothetical protein TrST_g9498 [Triparma strigata]|uniref:Uncharacterized protein n=1 Tax=Triparma strigata TaxID=1606541 RepID=A0A9W7AVH1_9STRA|nr:hypothetical protein TrST_g9498 [Triparma strigata]